MRNYSEMLRNKKNIQTTILYNKRPATISVMTGTTTQPVATSPFPLSLPAPVILIRSEMHFNRFNRGQFETYYSSLFQKLNQST